MMSYINETDFVIENKELVYPEIITDGLQLYYDAKGKRDTDYHRDTMLDMSGNQNHGKLQNFAYEKHSGYKDGLVFDYIDDKLVRPALNLKPDDFTFMLNGNIISFSPDGTVKRVQDGEVIESKGFNLIENGDVESSITFSTASYISFLKNGDMIVSSNYNTNQTVIPAVNGYKYYVRVVFSQGTVRERLYFRYDDNSINYNGATINETDMFSGIITADKTANANLRLYGSAGEKTKKSIMMIDLTQTFGAGKEPTKEQMDEIINRFGFIPNAQDLINRIEYKGNELGDMENIIDGLYKTGVLSGEEVYTDKADDAVVHVDVDGESYQHAGSGKNLFTLSYPDALKDFIRPRDYWVKPITLKANTLYTLSSKLVGNIITDATIMVWNGGDTYADRGANHAALSVNGIERTTWFNTGNVTEWKIAVYLTSNLESSKELLGKFLDNYQFQLEEGSDVTEYEPPAQTPDYPIEIHSLHDFDVVSSVGKENLLSNNKFGRYFGGRLMGYSERNYRLLNDVYYIYENPGSSLIGFEFSNPEENVTFSGLTSYSIISVFYQQYDKNGNMIGTQTSFRIPVHNGEFRSTTRLDSHHDTDYYLLGIGVVGVAGNDGWIKPKLEKGIVETPYSPAPKDISENSNHPLIDKINLLLDEPLRSVGDVKDRLFRDSDGLWKVERNVHYEELSSSTPSWSAYPSYDTDNAISTRVIRSSHTHSMSWRDIYSSHFISVNNSWIRDEAGIGYSSAGGTSVWIQIPKSIANNIEEVKQWADIQQSQGTPVQVMYPLRENKYIETLSQSLQDKLNNLRSFSESNYVYTVDGKTNLLDTIPLLNGYLYPYGGAQQIPERANGQTATKDAISVYPGAKIHLTKLTTGDNYWRIVWVDKDNNVVLRETSIANDLILTVPNGAYGMRVSYPNGSNAVIKFDKSNISQTASENLKPTLHAKFLYNNWYKEDRVINNLMIYNRALTNEEILQNYKTIKRRWGM